MWALSAFAIGLGELHYVSSRPSSECSKRYCSLSCNLALSCLDIQRVRVFGTAFFMKDYLTRLPMHNDGLEVRQGLQQMQTARPHLPPVYEMYSLRWNAKASQQE